METGLKFQAQSSSRVRLRIIEGVGESGIQIGKAPQYFLNIVEVW